MKVPGAALQRQAAHALLCCQVLFLPSVSGSGFAGRQLAVAGMDPAGGSAEPLISLHMLFQRGNPLLCQVSAFCYGL